MDESKTFSSLSSGRLPFLCVSFGLWSLIFQRKKMNYKALFNEDLRGMSWLLYYHGISACPSADWNWLWMRPLSFCPRFANAFSYYGVVLLTTELLQATDSCGCEYFANLHTSKGHAKLQAPKYKHRRTNNCPSCSSWSRQGCQDRAQLQLGVQILDILRLQRPSMDDAGRIPR